MVIYQTPAPARDIEFAGPCQPLRSSMKGFDVKFQTAQMAIIPFVLLFCCSLVSGQESGFRSIFDGKTLEGWDGNPAFWSVKDGAITGQTTKDNPTKGNTFIIWRAGKTADFELRLQFRIVGGNSGIQYRSREVSKWVMAGYQADFDGPGSWTGTLYEEKGRGVLAKRGSRVTVSPKGDKKVTGATSSEQEILAAVKKEDWNDYTIIAQGNHLVQVINGKTTIDLTDDQEDRRAMSGLLALQLHAGPPMKVQFRNIRIREPKAKKIAFMAGVRSHGYGSHEHFAGCMILADSLRASMPGYEIVVYRDGWPKAEGAFDGVDSIIMYCDGGGRHPANQNHDQIDALAKKGVGIVCLHYGVEVPKGPTGERFLDWIGGYFEPHWSVNPHWTAKYDKFPKHPITQGVKPFEINDEWYYHMRFRPEMKGVTPILTALPPKTTLTRPDGAHSGNPHVRAAIARGEAQHMAWAATREGGGRGFGFTGGHFHWNWGDPNFRKLVLNAIVWSAHGEVPKDGVSDQVVTLKKLEKNQDYPQPGNFNREAIRERFKLPADQGAPQKPGSSKAKPRFTSPLVTTATKGHRVPVEVDIKGAKVLHLVVLDGGNGYSCDWADWIEPRLVGSRGEKKLTDLKWTRAVTGWGQVRVNKNAAGMPLVVADKTVPFGIGTHANSIISYQIPEGYDKFVAEGGLDRGGTSQGACGKISSVIFQVFTGVAPAFPQPAGGAPGSRDPADALAGLDIAEGLEGTLFSSEPNLLSVTNLDIDDRGRIWVCEVVNYRKNNGKRPEGDRILILEDTDGDGICDKKTVYYQGRDIDSAMGLCVLGNRVIVSCSPNVWIFTDDDGDDKPDSKVAMFTKTGGAQHDHSAHSFIFGPDGKLYWNFGNTGKGVHDADGNRVVDRAGHPVIDNGKPYFGGMVFRCNLDGSGFEVVAHNFRNNYEVAIDSFGTLWQSDNDDDGNKGVRINYVMEFGNYGYRNELNGAGWKTARTGMHKEVPFRHWHQNDPGVVPNLLHTGAGSPAGITFYEGSLLPEQFRNQVLHCDPGPNIVRCYPVKESGAGYTATVANIAHGARDRWFRPADICTAPDGSIFITDWYDPGVGGHNMGDLERGRIFRIAPPNHIYKTTRPNYSTLQGAIVALSSPNNATRYNGWQALYGFGDKALPALETLARDPSPQLQARAFWLLGKIKPGGNYISQALAHKDPRIRIVGIRLARQASLPIVPVATSLIDDQSSQVRREVAIALRHCEADDMPRLWAVLASRHDGKDRWYLEALGIGAALRWDECFSEWLKLAGTDWNNAAGKDIIWRSRATQAPAYLARILLDPATPKDQHEHYLRAFDFHSGPEKEKALKTLLGL
jgi:putative membrane-bound dehydrogenase-like protein